jgi:2-keto-4-pentenoate hydratase/2-oxohepta-3-ene-1,7-dioic acid hydratase in catechol pathway
VRDEIGRTARHVDTADALSYVFGYICGLDMSVRSTEDCFTRKSYDTFTPLGPQLVTADEIGDPGALDLRLEVNGEIRQHVSTADLIVNVPVLIAYASSVMTLWPGDVILTGTPAGVGPGVDGDRVTLTIERVGQFEVSVSAATAIPYDQAPSPNRRPAVQPSRRPICGVSL